MDSKQIPEVLLNTLLTEGEYRYLYALLVEHDPHSEIGKRLCDRLTETMGKKLDILNSRWQRALKTKWKKVSRR
jgi:hypothetical protein